MMRKMPVCFYRNNCNPSNAGTVAVREWGGVPYLRIIESGAGAVCVVFRNLLNVRYWMALMEMIWDGTPIPVTAWGSTTSWS